MDGRGRQELIDALTAGGRLPDSYYEKGKETKKTLLKDGVKKLNARRKIMTLVDNLQEVPMGPIRYWLITITTRPLASFVLPVPNAKKQYRLIG